MCGIAGILFPDGLGRSDDLRSRLSVIIASLVNCSLAIRDLSSPLTPDRREFMDS
jgi:hypothetical protein